MVAIVSLVSFFFFFFFFFCKGNEGLGKLVNSLLTRFKDAVETFRQHSKEAYHVHSVSDMLTFMRIINNEQTPIDHQVVSAVAQQLQQNRELLKSIIKTIICGKQNVALCGRCQKYAAIP